MTTICVAFFMTTGLRIGVNYRKEKLRVFILWGLTWILLVTIYYPIVMSFWGIVFFGQGLPLFGYLFICSLAPIGIVIAVWAWSDLIIKKYQKQLVGATFIDSAIFVFIFMYNTFNNPTSLGAIQGLVSLRYGFIVLLYLFLHTILGTVMGFILNQQSRDATEPEVRLKGDLIWIAFLLFFSGANIDGFLPLSIITVCVSRIALTLGSIIFFLGFFPPKFVLEYVRKRNAKKKKSTD